MYIYAKYVLNKLSDTKDHFASQCTHICSFITTCLKSRLEWSSLEVTHAVLVLATQSWNIFFCKKALIVPVSWRMAILQRCQ